jgi:tripartite-type tricarboxylate transporter receptor subunit TctC
MKLPHRRQFLHLVAGAAVLPAFSRAARAQTYPTRQVRIIVGFAPGGATDIAARLMGQWLSERLAKPFVIENRPGAASNIGAEAVVNAAPDGHTLLMAGPSSAINATLYQKLGFNFMRDVAPVAAIAHSPNVMLVGPTVSANTVSELIALAQANPGRFKLASAGVGTATHLCGELFELMTGTNMVHVPYRGGAGAYDDLLAGLVDVYFPPLASSLGYIKAGQLRALAVTTASRHKGLNVPTIGEFVSGYEASTWFGIGAPRNTPAEIVSWLNQEINASLVDPKVKARIANLGGTVIAGSPAEFGKLIAKETEKWAKVIQSANVA